MNDFEREDEEERKVGKLEEDDEDNYSDDDFEQNDDGEGGGQPNNRALQVILEHTNESIEHSTIPEKYEESSSAHIEQFLKTATAEDMDIIRESLSNFHEASKHFTNFNSQRKEKDEDYIEEEFEEEIPEDEDNSSGEEHKFEVIRKEEHSQAQVSKKGRPVSAVYDLSQFKTGAQNQGVQSQRSLHQQPSAAFSVRRDPTSKLAIEKTTGTQALMQGSEKDLHGFKTNRQEATEQHSTLAPNLQSNRPNFSTNPFKRPFSEINPGKRKEQRAELNKGFQQTEAQVPQSKPDFNSFTQNQLALRDADNIDASYGGASHVSKASQKEVELNMIMQAISILDDS